jgi:hypothetical protein
MLDYYKSMRFYFPAIKKFIKGNSTSFLKLSSQTQNLQLLDFILTLCTRQPADAVLQVASQSALKIILRSGDLEAVKKQCKESSLVKISDLIESYQKIIPDHLQMLMNDIIADFKCKNRVTN